MDSFAPNSAAPVPGSAPIARQTAIHLARAGRLEELRSLADAGDPQGCRQLAVALVRAGRIPEVAARAAGGDRFARRALADWMVRNGRIDEAIDQMRELAETGNAGARRRLARLLAGQGRVGEAIAQLRRLPGFDRHVNVPGWMASQDRFDLLRQLASTGNFTARTELEYTVLRLWATTRLTAAIDLLADIDSSYARFDNLDIRLVNIASRWRAGRTRLRDEAIDLLGTMTNPVGRRARAGLLLAQGRYDEAITELRSLATQGDRAADEKLDLVLRAEKPARELRAFEHCTGNLRSVAFSPDGAMLATCDGNGHRIVVWNLDTGKHLHTLHTPGLTADIAFSDDGTMLAGNGWGRAGLWNTATGEPLRDLGADIDYADGVAFIADHTLVSGRTLWNTATGDRLLVLRSEAAIRHDERVTAIALSPDRQTLATSTVTSHRNRTQDWNPTVQLWNPTTGRHVRDLDIAGQPPVRSLALGPDNRLLAVASDKGMWLSDLTGTHIRPLGDHGADAVTFHPDGRLLATARRYHFLNAAVRLWNSTTGSMIGELNTPADAIAFSPDGTFLATADEDSGLVRLWTIPRPPRLRNTL
ncbi:WD40 repeat domain-containing protein [Nocardia seriolae]|uniref:WD40 repeat domain-containing protein n=1 Tax=Nocardia seriolae TaxID=37332 RepID=A0ABC8ATA4_9NOCA|nr:WD40 repeat domain-containing protein [Nocardia seriolae]GEM22619.1 hypothetical protein NS2_08580 [Nocardia seriolae NBRC 15557]APA97373.1 hypothetical protein NS506_03321 [Nocardia seriolae]QOW34348.1 WD40 repeat domain-containing protein [Nocardia seriolae]QUN18196.1 WD40 repeat domain-containing protein [Nocardia seriolae]WKY50480.1 WD40 repeat domain-containing protein [Nocardia seriolae]